MASHAELFVTRPKEPFYFARDFDGLREIRSEGDYAALFARAPATALAMGEGSTLYLASRVAVPAIRSFAPDAKLIVLLRDPLDFVASFHAHLSYLGMEDQPLEAAWDLQEARRAGRALPPKIREAGLLQYSELASFGMQVQRLFECFPREQVRIDFLPDVVARGAAAVADILGFLGVDATQARPLPRVNAHRRARSQRVAGWVGQPPRWMSKLAKRVKARLGIEEFAFLDGLRRLNTAPSGRAPVAPDFAARVRESLAEDQALLSRLLDERA